jgi:low affinity Fe/Cu permease
VSCFTGASGWLGRPMVLVVVVVVVVVVGAD